MTLGTSGSLCLVSTQGIHTFHCSIFPVMTPRFASINNSLTNTLVYVPLWACLRVLGEQYTQEWDLWLLGHCVFKLMEKSQMASRMVYKFILHQHFPFSHILASTISIFPIFAIWETNIFTFTLTSLNTFVVFTIIIIDIYYLMKSLWSLLFVH